jgi:5'-nucleotidase
MRSTRFQTNEGRTMKRLAGAATLLVAVLLLMGSTSAIAARPANDTFVQLLAINDFHGNIAPPSGSGGRIQVGVTSTGSAINVDAGGVQYLATHIKQLAETNSNTIFVGAGDQIGASPLISGIFHDEPTIEALNIAGMEVTAVGNHEFDEGAAELLRMQYGGCHPVDGCQDGDPFGGALFQYLAANVVYKGTNTTILPPYEIKKVGNVKIAFIGLTLEGTPSIVSAEAVENLEFRPEIQTVNAFVDYLRANEGVKSFVVLLHQGGAQSPPFANGFMDINRCDNLGGPIVDIVKGITPTVKVVVSAHTHLPYVCDNFQGTGKLLTSASSFGRLITDIDLRIDQQSKQITSATARNVIVTRDVPPDATELKLLDKYTRLSAPIANTVVGTITGDITQANSFARESALGDVISDAQLFSTEQDHHGNADVAFMNPGGIRADLLYANSPGGEPAGQVTYGELFAVQPFNNLLQTKTFTGGQIYQLLQEQWSGANSPRLRADGTVDESFIRILQVSNGFTYSYEITGTVGRVIPGTVMIGGVPVDPLASYRVTMNNFLGGGGDNFPTFTQGTDTLNGQLDIDAVVDYFGARSPVTPGPRDRITRIS